MGKNSLILVKYSCLGLMCAGLMTAVTACGGGSSYSLWGSTESANGVYKVGNPYLVDGTWYYPAEDYTYTEEGVASWYGPDFHNGITANGEVYDMHLMTAAHRTLPLPSIVRVTNLENGKSVVLRVNDRGPFVNNRIIDVSKLAAEKLDFHEQGTTSVRVEILPEESKELKLAMLSGEVSAQTAYTKEQEEVKKQTIRSITAPPKPSYTPAVEPAIVAAAVEEVETEDAEEIVVKEEVALPPEPKPVAKTAAPVSVPKAEAKENLSAVGLYVQIGAFSTKENAERFASLMQEYGANKINQTKVNGKDIYRVRMGAFDSGKEALVTLDKMRALGYKDARIVEETVVK